MHNTSQIEKNNNIMLFASEEDHTCSDVKKQLLSHVRGLLFLCTSVNVLWLANIICPLCLSQMSVTIAKHCLSYIPSVRETQEYHPLSLASFCPPSFPLLPPLPAEWPDQPHSLISIAGLRNTGPVVDMLASYPTGADKLLASLAVHSEESQQAHAARQQNTKLYGWT